MSQADGIKRTCGTCKHFNREMESCYCLCAQTLGNRVDNPAITVVTTGWGGYLSSQTCNCHCDYRAKGLAYRGWAPTPEAALLIMAETGEPVPPGVPDGD